MNDGEAILTFFRQAGYHVSGGIVQLELGSPNAWEVIGDQLIMVNGPARLIIHPSNPVYQRLANLGRFAHESGVSGHELMKRLNDE